jgi:hypothetical protein
MCNQHYILANMTKFLSTRPRSLDGHGWCVSSCLLAYLGHDPMVPPRPAVAVTIPISLADIEEKLEQMLVSNQAQTLFHTTWQVVCLAARRF